MATRFGAIKKPVPLGVFDSWYLGWVNVMIPIALFGNLRCWSLDMIYDI